MVVPGGRPLMIMWTWSGLRYAQPAGGKLTVPVPLSTTRHGLAGLLFTLTLNVQQLKLPQESVARQETVVTPGRNVLPLGGVQLTGVGFGPQLSLAVGGV